jgi:DNA-binding NarL/FixJ family response regulator
MHRQSRHRDFAPHICTEPSVTRIVIADDHAILREGLKTLLSMAPDMEVVGEAGEGQEAVQRTLELAPDVLLLDISMPGLGGIEALRMLRSMKARVRVVMLTMHAGPAHVEAAFSAGADGYIDKGSAHADLIDAVRTVRADGRFLSAAVEQFAADAAIFRPRGLAGHLSARERQILQLVTHGQSSSQIATSLALSPKTVDTYRSRLMTKLDVANVAALVKLAVEQGLVL